MDNQHSMDQGFQNVFPALMFTAFRRRRAVLRDTSTHNHLLSAYVRAMKRRAFMANQAHLNAIEPG